MNSPEMNLRLPIFDDGLPRLVDTDATRVSRLHSECSVQLGCAYWFSLGVEVCMRRMIYLIVFRFLGIALLAICLLSVAIAGASHLHLQRAGHIVHEHCGFCQQTAHLNAICSPAISLFLLLLSKHSRRFLDRTLESHESSDRLFIRPPPAI